MFLIHLDNRRAIRFRVPIPITHQNTWVIRLSEWCKDLSSAMESDKKQPLLPCYQTAPGGGSLGFVDGGSLIPWTFTHSKHSCRCWQDRAIPFGHIYSLRPGGNAWVVLFCELDLLTCTKAALMFSFQQKQVPHEGWREFSNQITSARTPWCGWAT